MQSVGDSGATLTDAVPAVAGSQHVLNVHRLCKHRVGGGTGFSVSLDNMELNRGEFCALVGPSGSGKSTLLDMLALVVEPSGLDRFELGGLSTDVEPGGTYDIKQLWSSTSDKGLALARRRCLGYVLQSGGLFPFLSVGENIDLPRRLLGLDVRIERTVLALSQFGLDWGYNKAVSELSGGERQRVAILRALSHRPCLVLADEPTAAVDQARALEIVSLLRDYARKSGAAVVMVTHDIGLLSDGGDRVFELKPDNQKTDWTAFSAIETRHD